MTQQYDFDLAVIGGGPGGYPAAIRAAQLGAKTCLIEKGHLGGVCANVGCIPTKALIHSAEMFLRMKGCADFGIEAQNVEVNFPAVAARRDGIVQKLRAGVAALLKANKIEPLRGAASFEDPHTLRVRRGADERRLTAAGVVIATGSAPKEIPGIKFDGDRLLNSTGAVCLNELPQSLLIIGGGYIGCEFAGAFGAFGAEVTIVEMEDRLLPLHDVDASRIVTKRLKKIGVNVLTGCTVEKVKKKRDCVEVALSSGNPVKAQKLLTSIGRRPFTEGLALENAGLETAGDGSIPVNEHMQTSRPHIYAVGDVIGGAAMLAHAATHEGLVAAAHITGALTAKMDYHLVPSCVFTFPEIASVGLTEKEAKEEAGEVIVKRFPFTALGKAHVNGETEGRIKMIADARTGQVLGVHIFAAGASSLIGEAALGIKLEATASEFAHTVHPHPTLTEALGEVAEGILGTPVNWSG